MVSVALGRAIANRQLLVDVLNRVYYSLENNADLWRGQRDQGDPDLFNYVINVFDGSGWIRLRFSVDDRLATGYLVVVGLVAEPY